MSLGYGVRRGCLSLSFWRGWRCRGGFGEGEEWLVGFGADGRSRSGDWLMVAM